MLIIAYFLYLGAVLLFGVVSAKNERLSETFVIILPFHVGGFAVAAVGMLIITAGLKGLLAPRFVEFDALVFLFVPFVAGLLGALSGTIAYLLSVRRYRSMRLLSLIGSLPLLLVTVFSIYDLFQLSDHYLTNWRDATFGLFVNGFPLIWICGLWYGVFRHYKAHK
jgi:hypothetical protein